MFIWQEWPTFFRGRHRVQYELAGELEVTAPAGDSRTHGGDLSKTRPGHAGIAKRQHYVPQFLLRNFAIAGTETLHVFDKHKSVSFKNAIRKSAAENYYYDVPQTVAERVWRRAVDAGEVRGACPDVMTFENSLTSVESLAAEIIARVLKAQSLSALENDDRQVLALFIGIQYVRGPAHRRLATQTGAHLRECIGNVMEAMGHDRERALKEAGLAAPSRDELIVQGLSLLRNAENLAPHFLSKPWLLYRTCDAAPFWISDSPVTIESINPESGCGTIRGLGIRNIESRLIFPWSPTLSLLMEAPEMAMRCDAIAPLVRLGNHSPSAAAAHVFMEALRSGDPLELTPQNVMHFNSLQVLNAERFLYACEDKFSMAGDMIAEDSTIRHGAQLAKHG